MVRENDITLLQEHWLLKFKQDDLRQYWASHDYFIASVDEDHPYSPLQPPRGYGGVAIVWKHAVTRICTPILKSPNIVAAKLKIDGGDLLVISVYMPCRGIPGADIQFSRVLDQVHQLLQDHPCAPTLIGGDWNASLIRSPPETRDNKLKQFISENQLDLVPIPPDVPTFMHHNKRDRAQIDYLITRSLPTPEPPKVHELPLSTSDHCAITTVLRLPVTANNGHVENTQPAGPTKEPHRPYPKINWSKTDLTKYKMEISVPPLYPSFTESMLALVELAKSLRRASELASPTPPPRRSKFNISTPEIREAARLKRINYVQWKSEGSPVDQCVARDNLTEAKSQLRRALRQEFRKRQDSKVHKINDARYDNKALMFRLIKPITNTGETEVLTYNGATYTDPHSIRDAWQSHYAGQVTPACRSDDYSSQVEMDFDFLVHISNLSDVPTYQAELRDVIIAIQSLNTRKAPDAFGLQAEHLRYGGAEVLQYILVMVNLIFRWRLIPRFLKEGILSSVYKNKPPISEPANHRGITVTVVMAKVVEKLMLKPMYTLLQSPLQCGFTREVSPLQAAWLVQQGIAEAQHTCRTLFVAYLDAKAAFDAVYVKSLLRKLYIRGVEGPLWDLFVSIHADATSRVKWGGQLSNQFQILQGVRQGGLTSTLEYKQFVDTLLWNIQGSGLGASFGDIDISAPTCADDVALMAFDPVNLQVMLQVAYAYSQQEGYKLQPKKCAVVTYAQVPKQLYPWTLGSEPIPVLDSTKHIGIERDSATGGNANHIAAVISKSNRAFFAKMKPNLSPIVALDIFQTTVLPILTYGTEVLVLRDETLDPLEKAQEFMLQQILGLPVKIPKYVSNFLLGVLPIQGVVHKKILGFFRTLITPGSNTLQIIQRDIALYGLSDKHSWMSMVSRVLALYDLPSAFSLVTHPPPPNTWKDQVTQAVNTHWEGTITNLMSTYPSLRFVSTQDFKIGKSHLSVQSVLTNPLDSARSRIRLKLLTGTYSLQSNRPSFNQYNSRMCPLCKTEVETRMHFLMECTELEQARRGKMAVFSEAFSDAFGARYHALPQNEKFLALMDPSSFALQAFGDTTPAPDLTPLETASRRLCYLLHVTRYRLCGLVPRRKRKKQKKSAVTVQQAQL